MCVPGKYGGYTCQCDPGYYGNGMGANGCKDIDECYTGAHMCDDTAQCLNVRELTIALVTKDIQEMDTVVF